MWAKLDCGWYESGWVDAARAPRASVLAAWAVALAWTVQHRTDGRLPAGRVEALLAYALELGREESGRIVAALVDVGAWLEVADGYQIADWDQPTRDDQDRARELAARRQARRREDSGVSKMSRRDSHAVSRRDTTDTSRRDWSDVSRRVSHAVSRSQIRSDQIRSDQNRSSVPRAPAAVPAAVPAREEPTPERDTEEAPTRSAGHYTGGDLSQDQSTILGALRRDPRLATIATAELAATIDGRRIARGHSVPEVVQAIDDAAAHSVDGQTTEALRRRVVTYTDRARPPARAVAPAQSEIPIERAWRVASIGGDQ